MTTRSRRALRLASSGALAMLTLAGLAAAGLRVTLSRANTSAPSDLVGHLIPVLLTLGLGLAACAAVAPVAARRVRESRRQPVRRPAPGAMNSSTSEDGRPEPSPTPIARA